MSSSTKGRFFWSAPERDKVLPSVPEAERVEIISMGLVLALPET